MLGIFLWTVHKEHGWVVRMSDYRIPVFIEWNWIVGCIPINIHSTNQHRV